MALINRKLKKLGGIAKPNIKATAKFHRVGATKSSDHKSNIQSLHAMMKTPNDREKITNFMRSEHFNEVQDLTRGDPTKFTPTHDNEFVKGGKKNVARYGIEKDERSVVVQKEISLPKKIVETKKIDPSIFKKR
jgi:formylmethanofuran dehydrogenase subunit A